MVPGCAVPGVSGMRLAAVGLPLKLFLSHQACISTSYAALPLVVFGYGLCWSQFVNGPLASSLAIPRGVVFIPVAGDVNRPLFVADVVWNRLVGLLHGFPSSSSLF